MVPESVDEPAAVAPEVVAATELRPIRPSTSRMRSRRIYAPSPGGWTGVCMSEWELDRASFSDHHPHDEINFVLEGELVVRIGATEVRGGPGTTIKVPAGQVGHYLAPAYARMLAIYGPNPSGADSQIYEYVELDGHSEG